VPATPAPTAQSNLASAYRLVAHTSELTWIRVRTEDGRMSEENIPAGETREWVSNRPFVLSIGNAGGVTLELNGHRLPPLGPSGAVIARLVVPAEGQ
jgi:cytoskeleton protein RodZ